MKSIIFCLCMIILITHVYGQEAVVKIEEDYTNPKSMMWEASDEYHSGTIEDGMYVSKAGKMHAQLDFKYDVYDAQKRYVNASDMEFTVVKLKGDKESFMCVQVDPQGDPDYPYLVFQYNALGEWKLTNYRNDATYKSGIAKMNESSNLIKIEHRSNAIHYSVNNEKVLEFKLNKNVAIEWNDIEVYSKNKKFVIALDRVVFIGYHSSTTFEKTDIKISPENTGVAQKNESSDKAHTGLVEFTVTQNGRELYGLRNSAGEIVLPANYSFIRWAGDYGLVGHPTAIAGTGVIDKYGKLIIDPSKYCDIQLSPNGSDHAVFVNGFAKIVICKDNGNLYGFINTSGKEVVAPQYVRVGEFVNGAAEVETKDGTVYKIDTSGKRK